MNKVPLTKIGADKMREELKKLKNEDRPRIIADIAEARAHGDLLLRFLTGDVKRGEALGHAGSTPVAILHRYGRGETLLLNFSMTGFPNIALPDTPESVASFIEKLFRGADATPTYVTQTMDGQRARNLETIRWRTGAIDIVALFRQSGGKDQPAVVKWNAPRSVSDLRFHQQADARKSFHTKVIASRPTFLVFAPEKFLEVKVFPNIEFDLEKVA